jgi:aryl-alcohol dehydrogenase-like predicted oxidoreductase
MRLRPLGKTGYRVSAIEFGAWAIGGSMWGGRDDDNAVAALEAALDFGINFIDTAAVYGDGHSERLVGRVLKERGGVNGRGMRCVIATKIPPRNGSLTGKFTTGTRFPPGDFRNQYFRGERLKETVRRVNDLRFLEQPGRTLPQAALLYVLHSPAVSTVIPGMRRPAQVEENATALEAPPLTPDEIDAAHQHRWVRNFYGGG